MVVSAQLMASNDEKSAYEKLGGATDKLLKYWGYASKGLKMIEKPDSSLSRGLEKAEKYFKCLEYVRMVQEATDETKRDGTILKAAVKIAEEIAKKFGLPLTSNPYYAYHKPMLDALANVLNAAHNSKAAVEAYRLAVSHATSKAIEDAFKRIESRKVEIVGARVGFVGRVRVASDIAHDTMGPELAQRRIQEYGGADRLAAAVTDLEAWRAMWAGLSFELMKLCIMTGVELNAATAAMHKVQSLIATLMGGESSASVVGGRAAINNIEWEKYDLIVGEGKPDRVTDPVEFAQSNREKAFAWAAAHAEMCDFVRTDQVVFDSLFGTQLERLNKVLYG
jgi:hypothetical protein